MDIEMVSVDEFEGVSGEYRIPGRELISMLGLNHETCRITVCDRALSISQVDAQISLRLEYRFWRYAGAKLDTNHILAMEFSEFLETSCANRLGYADRHNLLARKAGKRGKEVLGTLKEPYLVRDFLNDFPCLSSLRRIYGIGEYAGAKFSLVCRKYGLPFMDDR